MEVLDCVIAINQLYLSPFICFLNARIDKDCYNVFHVKFHPKSLGF